MPLRAIYKPESHLKRWSRGVLPYAIAILASGAALGLSLLIPRIGEKPFFVLFFVATAACAWLYGMASACASLVFSIFALIYFVLPPMNASSSGRSDYLIRLVVFIAASLVAAWLLAMFKTSQQELQLAQERFELAHEVANIWSWELDLATGKVVWSSGSKQPARRREDPVQVWLELVHPEDRDRVLGALKTAVDTLRPYAIEFRIVPRKGDLRWIASSGEFYKGRRGEQRLVGVNVDITLRKEAEKAAEIAARQEMAAQLAHEINNPLQGLMHALYLVREQVANEDVNQYSEMAYSQAHRISHLVTQLLQLYPKPHAN